MDFELTPDQRAIQTLARELAEAEIVPNAGDWDRGHRFPDELYPKLAAYYEDDPNVEVIVDRRKSERRDASAGGGQREVRDRRRPRVTGDFPPLSAA